LQIRSIELRQFRNYDHVHLEFPTSLNVFVGENAQGKTNLLEAVYLLAIGRSHRTTRESDMIKWGSDWATVRSEVDRQRGGVRVDVVLRKDGAKETKVAGEVVRRQVDLLGTVNVVVFSPDDLQLVKGAPGLRRRFLDLEIAQVSPSYRHHFARYQRVLKQRNNLLKALQGGHAGADALDPWDEQLIFEGSRVVVKRAQTVRRLSRWAAQMNERISGGRDPLSIEYRPFFAADGDSVEGWWEDLDAVEARFRSYLEGVRRVERVRGMTLAGPQRDDIAFIVGDVDLRYFGSQGQQRTAVLSCKLAELEFINEEAGEYPVLLLDDVMSELDDLRREQFLMTVTGRINTFITTTNLRSFSDDILDQASQYRVVAGEVL